LQVEAAAETRKPGSSGEVKTEVQRSSPAHNRVAEQRAAEEHEEEMSCLGRAAVPVKRVWRGLSARLRLRRATGKSSTCHYTAVDQGSSASIGEADGADAAAAAGLGRLRKEVRTCEYSDVHVMWEMLSSSSSSKSVRAGRAGAMVAGAGASAGGGKGSRRRSRVRRNAAVAWNRLASYCCAL
jgi:hypothetical protein